ncbi:MAG: PaaI family thioesterase [Phycisphaerae bacterium]
MSATTEPSLQLHSRTRQDRHGDCFAARPVDQGGLGLEFQLEPDGSVHTRLDCIERWQGYDGMMHGGILSALADAVMTNCLFAAGVEAVTGDLRVRFRQPVQLAGAVEAIGRIVRVADPLYVMQARLVQAGQVKVSAEAKFMRTGPSPATRPSGRG